MTWDLNRRRWVRAINSKFIYDRIVRADFPSKFSPRPPFLQWTSLIYNICIGKG